MTTLVHLATESGEAAMVADTLARRRDRLAALGVDVADPGPAGPPGRSDPGGADPGGADRLLVFGVDAQPPDEAAADMARRLDARVVLTLRPTSVRLFCAWALAVEHGLERTYESWVADSATDHPWLFSPEHLVQAWADIVGPRRVTVAIAPRRPTRPLERALRLPVGLLRPPRRSRSLSAAEAEFVRLVNAGFTEQTWPEGTRQTYVAAAIRALKRTGPHQPPVFPVPHGIDAVVKRAVTDTSETLEELGVRVVGSLDRLSSAPSPQPAPAMLSTRAAARAVAAAINASDSPPGSPLLSEASPRDLLLELSRRARPRTTR